MLAYTFLFFVCLFVLSGISSSIPQGLGKVGALRDQACLSHYPSDALPISGMGNGDLVLKNVNADDDGLYQCTVANHVGYSVCVVEVKVSGRYFSPESPLAGRVGLQVPGVVASALLSGLPCTFPHLPHRASRGPGFFPTDNCPGTCQAVGSLIASTSLYRLPACRHDRRCGAGLFAHVGLPGTRHLGDHRLLLRRRWAWWCPRRLRLRGRRRGRRRGLRRRLG